MRFIRDWRPAVSVLLVGLPLAAGLTPTGAAAAEVNVYTTREPGLIKPLFEAFTKQTGIEVRATFVQQGLAERVAAEGRNSPADLLTEADYGSLINLAERGLTQKIDSAVLNRAGPVALRDPDGAWYALSMRARAIWVSKDRVLDQTLTYENLADPRWKGRVCTRAGQHPYNVGLISRMIAKNGAEATGKWLAGVKANLGRKPGGGDRDVARDILAGICDIGIGNSYYVGLMRSGKGGKDQESWGNAIRVILPTFADGKGSHVDVSGAAVARFAPNKDNAIKLLEFMVGDEAQKIYAEIDYEYPVKEGAKIDPLIAALGKLKIDPEPLISVAARRKEASQLVDKIGFDH